MSKQSIRKPLGVVLGAALVAGLGSTSVASAAQADENLFSMQELTSGYLTAGAHETGKDGDEKKDGEGKCGEGKCGEGKCGDDKEG